MSSICTGSGAFLAAVVNFIRVVTRLFLSRSIKLVSNFAICTFSIAKDSTHCIYSIR